MPTQGCANIYLNPPMDPNLRSWSLSSSLRTKSLNSGVNDLPEGNLTGELTMCDLVYAWVKLGL